MQKTTNLQLTSEAVSNYFGKVTNCRMSEVAKKKIFSSLAPNGEGSIPVFNLAPLFDSQAGIELVKYKLLDSKPGCFTYAAMLSLYSTYQPTSGRYNQQKPLLAFIYCDNELDKCTQRIFFPPFRSGVFSERLLDLGQLQLVDLNSTYNLFPEGFWQGLAGKRPSQEYKDFLAVYDRQLNQLIAQINTRLVQKPTDNEPSQRRYGFSFFVAATLENMGYVQGFEAQNPIDGALKKTHLGSIIDMVAKGLLTQNLSANNNNEYFKKQAALSKEVNLGSKYWQALGRACFEQNQRDHRFGRIVTHQQKNYIVLNEEQVVLDRLIAPFTETLEYVDQKSKDFTTQVVLNLAGTSGDNDYNNMFVDGDVIDDPQKNREVTQEIEQELGADLDLEATGLKDGTLKPGDLSSYSDNELANELEGLDLESTDSSDAQVGTDVELAGLSSEVSQELKQLSKHKIHQELDNRSTSAPQVSSKTVKPTKAKSNKQPTVAKEEQPEPAAETTVAVQVNSPTLDSDVDRETSTDTSSEAPSDSVPEAPADASTEAQGKRRRGRPNKIKSVAELAQEYFNYCFGKKRGRRNAAEEQQFAAIVKTLDGVLERCKAETEQEQEMLVVLGINADYQVAPLQPKVAPKPQAKLPPRPRLNSSTQELLRSTKCGLAVDASLIAYKAKNPLVRKSVKGKGKNRSFVYGLKLLVFYDVETGLPIHTRLFNPSISEYVVAKWVVMQAKKLGYNNFTLILDRGYDNREFLEFLAFNKIKYVLMSKSQTTREIEVLESTAKLLTPQDPRYYDANQECFVETHASTYGEMNYSAHPEVSRQQVNHVVFYRPVVGFHKLRRGFNHLIEKCKLINDGRIVPTKAERENNLFVQVGGTWKINRSQINHLYRNTSQMLTTNIVFADINSADLCSSLEMRIKYAGACLAMYDMRWEIELYFRAAKSVIANGGLKVHALGSLGAKIGISLLVAAVRRWLTKLHHSFNRSKGKELDTHNTLQIDLECISQKLEVVQSDTQTFMSNPETENSFWSTVVAIYKVLVVPETVSSTYTNYQS